MTSKIKEGLGDLAHVAEKDHEVQMARADLYKIAKYAIKLHDMLKGVTEVEGLEGWQQSKITKAADYIGSVYHALDYDLKFNETYTPTKDKEDYNAKKKALQDIQNDPETAKDPELKAELAKRKAALEKDKPVSEARDTHCSDKCCGSDVKAEDCTCPPTCKHCNCNAVKEHSDPYKLKIAQRLKESLDAVRGR